MVIARLMTAAVVVVLYAGWTAAYAQTPGTVRAQGRDVGTGTQEAPSSGPAQPYFDVREEMRKFVQDISAFAKGYDPNFIVVTQNGLELLSKQREGDEDRVAPARTYMLSVDAILQEALYYGVPEPDAATKNERREKLLGLADTATKNGVKVLVIDGDVRMFVSGGLRGGYSERVDEIHEKEHPQCRKLRRSRVYRARSG